MLDEKLQMCDKAQKILILKTLRCERGSPIGKVSFVYSFTGFPFGKIYKNWGLIPSIIEAFEI